MSVPTFIVGTGRCGSTMLSNMLREHPQVLSLSEFFSSLVDSGVRLDDTFSSEPVDGRQFWEFVAAIPQSPGSPTVAGSPRRNSSTPTRRLEPASLRRPAFPVFCHRLPHLTSDHDAFFAELEGVVCAWPTATKREHYHRLFDWLTRRFAKRLWIERSGGALHMLGQIQATFPDARFIHLVRDGRDASISMLEHIGFRLYFVMSAIAEHLGVDPLASTDRTHVDRVPVHLRPFLPEHFDAGAFRAFRVPLPLCGGYWSFQIEHGLKLLSALPADRLLTLRYEDFFGEPKQQLDSVRRVYRERVC